VLWATLSRQPQLGHGRDRVKGVEVKGKGKVEGRAEVATTSLPVYTVIILYTRSSPHNPNWPYADLKS
jgi:hypothetical protein